MADKVETREHIEEHHISKDQAKVTRIDSDDEEVAQEAIGGTNAELPAGYYRSWSFIGTCLVSIVATLLS
jgi:hypothetical protein